ncbi:MAG: hypothetical protein ACRDKT_06580 [Actinomycetota bacterium]
MRLVVSLAFAAIVLLASTASTATNAISPSGAGQGAMVPTANEMKPAECNGVAVSGVVSGPRGGRKGGSLLIGSNGPDLLIADAAANIVEGRSGDDCLVGGAGNDTMDGGAGNDVCVGGPGADQFVSCETQWQ